MEINQTANVAEGFKNLPFADLIRNTWEKLNAFRPPVEIESSLQDGDTLQEEGDRHHKRYVFDEAKGMSHAALDLFEMPSDPNYVERGEIKTSADLCVYFVKPGSEVTKPTVTRLLGETKDNTLRFNRPPPNSYVVISTLPLSLDRRGGPDEALINSLSAGRSAKEVMEKAKQQHPEDKTSIMVFRFSK